MITHIEGNYFKELSGDSLMTTKAVCNKGAILDRMSTPGDYGWYLREKKTFSLGSDDYYSKRLSPQTYLTTYSPDDAPWNCDCEAGGKQHAC
jgi:hypothetical protein